MIVKTQAMRKVTSKLLNIINELYRDITCKVKPDELIGESVIPSELRFEKSLCHAPLLFIILLDYV